MENVAPDEPTMILKVKIKCVCEKCRKKLEKKLLQFDDIDCAKVEPKKELVSIIGQVKATDMQKYLASKVDANAEILYYKKIMPQGHRMHQCKGSNTVKAKLAQLESKDRHVGGGAQGKGGGRERNDGLGGAPPPAGGQLWLQGHKIEAYEPPKFDTDFCRDKYCKTHQSRAPIGFRVGSIHDPHHPHHTTGYSFPQVVGVGGSQAFSLNMPFAQPSYPLGGFREPRFLSPRSFQGTSKMPAGYDYHANHGNA